jgi:hypothetical protein
MNHKLCGRPPSLLEQLIGWMDRTSLLKCESGRIAIAVLFQTSRVIPLVVGVRQRQPSLRTFLASYHVCGGKSSVFLGIVLTGANSGSGQPDVQLLGPAQLFLVIFHFSNLCLLACI